MSDLAELLRFWGGKCICGEIVIVDTKDRRLEMPACVSCGEIVFLVPIKAAKS